MTIKIGKPMMRADTGRREVGLAVDKVYLEGNIVEVEISYRRKSDNTRLYPNNFVGSKEDILKYPQKVIKGVRLVYVPLDTLKEITPKEKPLVIIKTEPRNYGEIPTRPCWVCHGMKFWKTIWGEYICSRCHPSPNSVEEIEVGTLTKT